MIRPTASVAVLAAGLLALAACSSTAPGSTTPAPPVSAPQDAGDTMRFSGTVQAIDNGCFADGVCSVTVATEGGTTIKVVTLVGWSQDTWGQRDPALQQGQTAQVYCRKTLEGCTLNGDAGYYVRASR